MDESSRSGSGDDDSLPPAQPQGIYKWGSTNPSGASSTSVSSSSSSSVSSSSSTSSSSSSAQDDDDTLEASSSVRRNGTAATVTNKYIGFQRKPISSPEEYPTLGQRRQDRSYSDSDNEYEHEIFHRSKDRQGRDILDMDVHRDGEWGTRSLVDTLVGTRQLESLIGWAHDGAAARMATHRDPGFVNDAVDNENPLSRLPNDPLPLSYLNHLMLQSGRIPDFHETLTEKFDTSAIVAIGMILEEILTASLLPFAGCHVLRCRQLESKPSTNDTAVLAPPSEVKLKHPISNQPITFDPRNLSDEESAFVAWTLPPEEAILKAARQGMLPDTGIPLVRDPIRSASCPSPGTFELVKARNAIQRLFAKSNQKDESFLSANRDLLDIFLVKKRYKRKRKELVSEHPFPVETAITEGSVTDLYSKVPGDGDKSNDETITKKIKVVEI